MSRYDADLLVAGGGPAGLAASIRASELGLRVIVLEPESPPIDKACGEGLMPAALHRLDELGVTPTVGHPIEGIRYVDAREADCSAVGDFSGQGRGVRRTELHRALQARAAQVGVDFASVRVDSVHQDGSGVEAGGYRGRHLIAADGLHSDIRRLLDVGESERRRSRYGIRRHYRRSPWRSRVEVHLGSRAEAYVTPVAEDTVGVAFLFEDTGRFDELMTAFPNLRDRLDGAEIVSEDQGAGPFEQRVSRRVVGRTLLAGDAAGYLDALTGEGVALALETGTAAAEAVAAGDLDDYERRYRGLTRAYFGLTEALLRVTRWRWLHRPLIGLLDRVPGLFDGVLRLLGGSESGWSSESVGGTRPIRN
jgi:flavin-dependent dehydrogenase